MNVDDVSYERPWEPVENPGGGESGGGTAPQSDDDGGVEESPTAGDSYTEP